MCALIWARGVVLARRSVLRLRVQIGEFGALNRDEALELLGQLEAALLALRKLKAQSEERWSSGTDGASMFPQRVLPT